MITLGDITVPKVDQSGPPKNGDFIYVDISSVDNKAKRIVEPKRLPVEGAPSRARQRLAAGDVLVSMTRPNLNAVALVPSELDGAIGSTGFHVLRANERTEPRWLYYAVQNRSFVQAMSEVVQGALYPAVRPKDIRGFEVDPPPVNEQRRIVAEIEKQFSRLDEAVAGLQRVKANLKRYKSAVLKSAVAGRLVETEADLARREGRDYETGAQLLQRILETRRSQWQGKGKYKEPAAPDATDLPELPEGWVMSSGAQLFRWSSGVNLPVKTLVGGSIPVYGGNGVNGGHSDANVSHKTVVIGRVGAGCGNVHLIEPPAWITDNAIYATWTPTDCSLSYLANVFLVANLNAVAAGSGQPFVNQTILNDVLVPLPPLAEQHRIVAEVDRLLSIAREAEADVEANLKRAQGLRQAILSKAFCGGLQ